MLNIILVLVIIAIVALIAAQNSVAVTLTLLFWHMETSLSAVIFFSLFVGVLLAAIFLLSSYVRRSSKSRKSSPEGEAK